MPLLDKIISVIAPFDCLACGNEGDLLCELCLPKAVIVKRPTCYRCNRLSDGGRTCVSCRSSSQLAGVSVASHYDGAIKQLVYALKYERARSAAQLAAALLTPLLNQADFDLVVGVPSAGSRYRQRGYNQAALIAKQVAAQLAIPYSEALMRTKDIRQVGTARAQRLAQVKGIFVVSQPEMVFGSRILLVDDVVTTGATMAECAKVLKDAGVKRVWGAAVAKH